MSSKGLSSTHDELVSLDKGAKLSFYFGEKPVTGLGLVAEDSVTRGATWPLVGVAALYKIPGCALAQRAAEWSYGMVGGVPWALGTAWPRRFLRRSRNATPETWKAIW